MHHLALCFFLDLLKEGFRAVYSTITVLLKVIRTIRFITSDV